MLGEELYNNSFVTFENLAFEMYSRQYHPNIKNVLVDDLRFKLFFQREGKISRYNSKCL